jgi:hypothetical protein
MLRDRLLLVTLYFITYAINDATYDLAGLLCDSGSSFLWVEFFTSFM